MNVTLFWERVLEMKFKWIIMIPVVGFPITRQIFGGKDIWWKYHVMTNQCVLVIQLCPTLCDPMDYSPPGSSVHGILQARILEWVAISFSRGSSQHRCQTRVSCISYIGRWIHYHCTTWEALPLTSVLLLLIILFPIDFTLHFYLFSNGDGFWFL